MALSPKQFHQRLQPLLNPVHLKNLVNVEIIENEDKLIAIKRDEYEQGDIYSNGSTRSYKWKSYSDEKRILNPRAGGKVDLILTGDFIKSFQITEKGKGYIFKATDRKTSLITNRYGKGIFDLRDENFIAFHIRYVYPGFLKAINTELGQ